MVLIGASENAEQELGIEFRADEETECTADVLEDKSFRVKLCASRSLKASGNESREQLCSGKLAWLAVPERFGCCHPAVTASGASDAGKKDRKWRR